MTGRRLRSTVVAAMGLLLVTASFAGVVTTVGATSSTSAASKQVDVVFVVDQSKSMSDEIDGLKRNLGGFVGSVENQNIDARYALVTFRNDAEVDQRFTADADQVHADLEGLEASGGGDVREDSFDALVLATELDYREDATRVVIHVTDSIAHTNATRETSGQPSGRVTDETMSTMVDRLRGFGTYIAVSRPASSTDDFEPCSSPMSATCGDPQVLAEQLGGTWIDITSAESSADAFEGILDRSAATIGQAAGGAEWKITGHSLNASVVETDEPVEVTVQVQNVGTATGSYVGTLTADGKRLSAGAVQVGPGATGNLTLLAEFDEAGSTDLYVEGTRLGTVDVIEQSSTTVTTERADPNVTNVSGVTGTVQNAEGGIATSADISSVTPNGSAVALETLDLTVVRDSTYTFEVALLDASGNATADVPAPPSGTTPLATFEVNSSVSDRTLENATVGFAVSKAELTGAPADVSLYRYEDGGWLEMDTRVVNETADAYHLRANTSGFSTFTVAVRESAFQVQDASLGNTSLAAGETLTASATVRNGGRTAGNYTVALEVGDRTVDTTEIRLEANATRQVTLSGPVRQAGTFDVTVGNRSVGTVDVTAASTPTEDSTATATPTASPTTAPATATATPSAGSPTAGDGPGLGAVTALLALLSVAALAARRAESR